MKRIAHRGNISGPNPERENQPEYILEAIQKGYDCEIDIRYIDGQYFLGHDDPIYEIELSFLYDNREKLWIHCKNFEALDILIQIKELNIFWHENDKYTLTSHQYLWTYPGNTTTERSIIVMPEWNNFLYDKGYGICSDYIDTIKNTI